MDMELLLVILTILGGLLVLDILAVTFGADSRDGMVDDWAR
jgi:hypothetical protein